MALAFLAAGCSGDPPPPPPEPPPASSLVEDAWDPVAVRRADLDGDGVTEVIVSSVSRTPGLFGLPQAALEVFAHRGTWRRVLDGAAPAPPGAEGAAPTILGPPGSDVAIGQRVDVLEVVDFRADGTPEIVVGVANAGASGGPLEVWVIAYLGEEGFRTEFYETTSRGGELEVEGRTLTLEFGVYRRRDPGCCPSRIERQTIGFDEGAGEITVLSRERERA